MPRTIKKVRGYAVHYGGKIDQYHETFDQYDFYAIFPKRYQAKRYADNEGFQEIIPVLIIPQPAKEKKQ